ncbi:DNA cytosine methyltransferase [Mesorhizobium sp. ESP-6-4]|uniref:DNA cytosine methyltransferase n=1 Tax=Mesorhizobium sp. ESP-6-4 TaxID=2876624 RepID=UPI001CCA9A27|nr:DNA cytosine methyltransferase [Mesorhizobium sp. ESP-6-4]MBZ9659802.1 DNA cytosine methyltransferase [Mesorhizobium sp. ESP-6-4]
MSKFTFISMFSGIEAASVAFTPLDWKAICFAEFDKAASAVLAHHYPDVPNVGDMSKHDWSQYRGKVDVVCGGPPCQAFSVAGLRESLNDARGNLSLVYMKALHAIKPRNAIVENVPGWLNTPDNAFGCFLAGIVGADDALPAPGGNKWPNAGMVAGPRARVAWRVLDAQYFGLAQRRKRVLVVADFGNGADPAAVLFERVGMQGNPAPSREKGEDVAGTISARTSGGGGLGTDFDLAGELQYSPEIARCDATREGSSQDFESTTMVAVEVAPTMRAGGNVTGGDRPYGMDVDTCDSLAIVHAIQAGALRTNPSSGPDGVGVQADVAYTLEARAEVQAVCQQVYSIMPQNSGRAAGQSNGNQGGDVVCVTGTVTHTLTTEGAAGGAPMVATSAVRRLTPRECERLQGFPDDYTRIPVRKTPKKVTRLRPDDMWECIDGEWWLMAADGPRYKQLGNSWAVPKFRWLGERIQRLMPAKAAAITAANDNQERIIAAA